jgi:hypothetical protein
MRRLVTAGAALGALGACHPFALKQEPFTPDSAPVTEVAVADGDTTFVLRTDAYVLRARSRDLLWARRTLDDAAWRYRWLLGVAPRTVELRADSAELRADARGAGRTAVPTAAPRWTSGAAAPAIAWRAARAWVAALVADSAGGAGASRAPWWFEAGAAQLIADADGRVSALRAAFTGRDALPLAELLAAQRPPAGSPLPTSHASAAPGQPRRARGEVDRAPPVGAQGASLLLFLRERDAGFVPVLAAELPRGRAFADLLATRPALPSSPAALEAEWRKWLGRQPGARGVRVAS